MTTFAWITAAILGAFALGTIVGVTICQVREDDGCVDVDELWTDVPEPHSNVTLVDPERWSRSTTALRHYEQNVTDGITAEIAERFRWSDRPYDWETDDA